MADQINNTQTTATETQETYYFKNKPYKPLSGSRLASTIAGTVIGGVSAIITIICYIYIALNPLHPGFLVGLGSVVCLILGFVTGVVAIVFLSLSLPNLILLTRKVPPKNSKYLALRIILPCALTLLYICGFAFSVIGAPRYPYPTFEYKGAVFEYYEDYNEDGSNSLFREGTVIVGLAPDSPVPERIEIPSEINGNIVHTIYNNAFRDNKTITEVVFSDDLLYTIKENAFEGCSSLRKVVFNHSAIIESHAFKDCTSLNEFVKEEGEGYFGRFVYESDAFEGCPNAESLKQQLK